MNVQNVPRNQRDVKSVFLPKLDALMYFDYASIEPRLLAFYMATQGDDSLASEFRAGKDVYIETAKKLERFDEIGDRERQIAKQLMLSMIYGGGVPTLMKQLKIDRREAAALLKAFHQARPGVKALKEAVWERYQERGYLTTLFHRHLHPQSEHLALNALIQGCGADLIRDAMLKVHEDLSVPWASSHMVNSVHDEIQLDCAEDEIPGLVERIPYLMKNEIIEKHVPVLTSIEISRTTWADKQEYAA